jgi:hypothetical protein
VDFRAYLDRLFEQPKGEVAAATVVRNFSIWFFGLLRNFVLVGLLKYFYDKSGSPLLFYIHQFALFVIFIYCLSYIDQWYVNVFSFLENRKLAHWLNLAVNAVITVALFLIVNRATTMVVTELSKAHAPV